MGGMAVANTVANTIRSSQCWGKVLERQVGGEVDKVDELEE